ncbi:MAG: tRNA (adenosine(37)-N6)-threonylcarbamoyltransferase complex ATPase subunit type 1 TsaE [Candidatus Schekmanbacteria bacterium]|nr:tRNA (adenosine(37)-N6)-threonylcarbamoyltransferase complex ATPase subunit type 1 TsaE [Candidatus Schekmanbacteria bacterium]
MTFNTSSAIQTKRLGYLLGKNLFPAACLALSGELGSGKTCLVQGIVSGLGGDENNVTSPSYTLINQYKALQGIVYHADLYRLNSKDQIYELGLEENWGDGMVLIEWPELILHDLNRIGFMQIFLKALTECERRIELVPYGNAYQTVLNNLRREDISAFTFLCTL